ncbi:MAG: response regulator, partial [Anaerolineales bacterium]|nr:response regulator [Anaerolineales bacterium]
MQSILVVEESEFTAPIAAALRQSQPAWLIEVADPLSLFSQDVSFATLTTFVLGHRPPQVDALALWQRMQEQGAQGAAVLVAAPEMVTAVSQALQSGMQGYVLRDTQQHYLHLLPSVITQAYAHWCAAHSGKKAAHARHDIFADLLDVTMEAVIVIDEADHIVFFNNGAVDMFGFLPEEIAGQSLSLLLPLRFHDIHERLVWGFRREPQVARPMSQRCLVSAQHRDGHEFQAEATITKLTRNGRLYMAAILRDITERLPVESSLNQYTHRLEALREMDQAILAARLPQEVAQAALAHLHQLVPYQRASIMTFDPEDDTIKLLAVAADTGQDTLMPPTLVFHDEQAERVCQAVITQLQADPQASPLDTVERTLQAEGELVYIIVPLLAQDHLYGVLNLGSGGDYLFTHEHEAVVQEVARPVAMAIQQARLLEIERTQRELTETLRQVAAVLSSTLDHEQVLRIILEQLARVVSYDSASVMLADGFELQVVARRDIGKTRPLSQLRFEALSHVREVLEHSAPVIIADTAVDSRWQSLPETEYIRCWLGVPLVVKNLAIGLINLNKEQAHYYTKRDAETAVAFADQAAVAVENAQLYSRAQHEINERKQAEAALQAERALLAQRVEERTAELTAANAQLARAVRARDDFLASMTHELRTPLNAILGMAEILHTGLYGPLSAQQQDLLETIAESGYHLLDLVNDILDVAKIEAGQMKLEIFPTYVLELCQRCVELVQRVANKKSVTISVNIADSVGTILADETRLQQILVNLLNNAIKFTMTGQQVGLDVQVDATQQTMRFTVWDTGIGMALADIRRLFEGPNGPTPFMQLDSGLTRHYEGTGLGLSLIYRLTELHGGSLTINSAVGQGSRFTVCLPLQPPPLESYEEGGVRQNGRSAPTILLAEDNDRYLRSIAAHLSARGYRLLLAHNGREAVRQARTTPPDLMVMDLQMPELDGLRAIDFIRTELGLQTIPIIAMTSLVLPGDKLECLERGADVYLPKPFLLPHLAALIEQLLG